MESIFYSDHGDGHVCLLSLPPSANYTQMAYGTCGGCIFDASSVDFARGQVVRIDNGMRHRGQ